MNKEMINKYSISILELLNQQQQNDKRLNILEEIKQQGKIIDEISIIEDENLSNQQFKQKILEMRDKYRNELLLKIEILK